MNTDDRQQHIDTLADEIAHVMVGSGWYANSIGMEAAREAIGELFDSTDPAVHDALTAALIAHADRGRVLAALADAGWLDEETQHAVVDSAFVTRRCLRTPWRDLTSDEAVAFLRERLIEDAP